MLYALFRIGDWVAPSDGLRRANRSLGKAHRVEDIGKDYTFTPALDCVKIAGVWVYASDCTKTGPPPPTLAEKEAASNAEDGWRKRRDDFLRDTFTGGSVAIPRRR